jgi:hypothetical protein
MRWKVLRNARELRRDSAPGAGGARGAASAPAAATLLPSMMLFAPYATSTTFPTFSRAARIRWASPARSKGSAAWTTGAMVPSSR